MQCINSVKNQKYTNIEIILVNDGSTDTLTTKIISEILDPQIKILNKENGGLAAARNSGIRIASGEIILPLDADDFISPDYIIKGVELFIDDNSLGIVTCKGKYFGSSNEIMDNSYSNYKNYLQYNSLFCSSMFRKSDFLAIGMYNKNMTKGLEDWDMFIRLINYKKKVIQIPEVFFYYRQSQDSMLTTLNKQNHNLIEMENILFKNNVDFYIKEWGSMIKVIREYERLKNQEFSLDEAMESIKKTMSYRLGNFILYPLKLIKKMLKK
jgi:glycosyltransferase involved in cell wall biosynthesis